MKQLLLMAAGLCLSAASLCAFSGDNRKRLEDDFNNLEKSGLYTLGYDLARSRLQVIIDESLKAKYWDISLKALSELANLSDMNYQYQVQRETVMRGEYILNLGSDILDPLDPLYTIRGNMIIMTGQYYTNNGELEKAAGIFLSLIQRLNRNTIQEKKVMFDAYGYLADLYMKMGLYEKVYKCYLLAEKSIPDGKEDHFYYSYLHSLYMGSYFYRIKNYNIAKTYYTKALKKISNHKPGPPWNNYVKLNYNILALIYQSLDMRDSALICLQKSLEQQRHNDPDIQNTYEYYGDCLLNFKDFRGALGYYEKIYKITAGSTSFNVYKKVQVLSKIGEAWKGLGNYSEAIKKIQLAFAVLYKDSAYLKDLTKNPELTSIQADIILIRLLILKSDVLFEQAKIAREKKALLLQSLAAYHLATHVIDEFRHMINTNDFKEFFVTDIRGMYENAMNACYLAYNISRNDSIIALAFYFMEKSKNQVLLDAIKTNRARKLSHIPDSLVNTENNFKNRIVQLQNRLYNLKFNDADPQLVNQCQYESARTQNEYEKFLKRLELDFPRYFRLKYSLEEPGLGDIMHNIGQGILIEYLVGDKFIAWITLDRHKPVFRFVPRDEAFDHGLGSLLHDLGNSDIESRFSISTYGRFVRNAGFLYSRLLKTTLDSMKKSDRLIIIPDGILCLLPFDILINGIPGNLNTLNYGDLNYTLKNYSIRYEFSAALLSEQRDFKEKKHTRNKYVGFAPGYFKGAGLQKVRILGKGQGFLMPLKFSNEEVQKAAGIFGGKAFTGLAANVKTFKNAISARIIHFAGHTIINDSIPELSGLFFSADDRKLQDTEGEEVLYLNEIFNLDLNSDLAILSACESGTGKFLKGEGLISLGRAFKYAGCPNLIMSLWKVNDRSASEIIDRFCRNLKKGQRTDDALRNAKLFYLNNTDSDRHAHPFYWSTFILIGDNEPLFGRNRIFLLIPAIIILLAYSLFRYYRAPRDHAKRSDVQ